MDFVLNFLPYVSVVIVSVIVLFILSFIPCFFIPAFKKLKHIKRITEMLNSLPISGESPAGLSIEKIGDCFRTDEHLLHLWEKYAETLHPDKKEIDETGMENVVGRRSTVPAEIFFTYQTVADIPVNAEFFKHLPGILTGLGIIGTFSGVLRGLLNFHVSDNPMEVRESLQDLLVGLKGAFTVSLIAIFFAILLTFIEKLILSRLYKQIDALCLSINSLYQSGIGEEYLSRLVNASEESATQSKHLKDSLVIDLKQILTELTTHQVNVIQQSAHKQVEALTQTGQVIAQAVSESLKEPLEKISLAVNRTSEAQSDGIEKLLVGALESFSSRLENLFGGQLTGVNTLLQQTVQSIGTALERFEHIAGSMDTAGQEAVQAMSGELARVISTFESRQTAMNEEITQFVFTLKEMIQTSQQENSGKMQTAIELMGSKILELGDQLSKQTQSVAVVHEEHQRQLGTQVEMVMDALSKRMLESIDQSLLLKQQVALASDRMEKISTDAVSGMNAGAGKLQQASEVFLKSSQGMAEILQKIETLTQSLTINSSTLSSIFMGAKDVLSSYQGESESFQKTISEMNIMLENIKINSSITKDLLSQMQQAASVISDAQSNVSGFFESANHSLGSFHRDFAESIKNTLIQGNVAFNNELSNATSILAGSIRSLSDTLDTIPKSDGNP